MQGALTDILRNRNHVAGTQHQKTFYLSSDGLVSYVTDDADLQQRLDHLVQSPHGKDILQTLCRIEV